MEQSLISGELLFQFLLYLPTYLRQFMYYIFICKNLVFKLQDEIQLLFCYCYTCVIYRIACDQRTKSDNPACSTALVGGVTSHTHAYNQSFVYYYTYTLFIGLSFPAAHKTNIHQVTYRKFHIKAQSYVIQNVLGTQITVST